MADVGIGPIGTEINFHIILHNDIFFYFCVA